MSRLGRAAVCTASPVIVLKSPTAIPALARRDKPGNDKVAHWESDHAWLAANGQGAYGHGWVERSITAPA
jgi:hypothetical protein